MELFLPFYFLKKTKIKNIKFSGELENIKSIKIDKDTIIADLVYDERCGMWFDHHISHKTNKKFKGFFKLEKSCARVIFDYYKGKFPPFYKNLTEQLDKADSGGFTKEDVKNNIPLFQLNFLLFLYPFKDKERNKILNKILKEFLQETPIESVVKDNEIKSYLEKFEKLHQRSLSFIKKNGKIKNEILVIDSSDKFRMFYPFKLYLRFPEIKYILIINKRENITGALIVINNFNSFKYKNLGEICKNYGGGGHKEIGGFRFKKENKNKVIKEIIGRLS